MVFHIQQPTRIKSAGNKEKLIDEFIGRVNSGTSEVSIARMKSPPGWEEPPQTPAFNEYTLVLKGAVHVRTGEGVFIIRANEAFIAEKGVTIQYSTPEAEGAEYIAVCVPGFSPNTVNRED
jgi:mannose-6-phosphate isomerase-like protein (cupin superfamily)